MLTPAQLREIDRRLSELIDGGHRWKNQENAGDLFEVARGCRLLLAEYRMLLLQFELAARWSAVVVREMGKYSYTQALEIIRKRMAALRTDTEEGKIARLILDQTAAEIELRYGRISAAPLGDNRPHEHSERPRSRTRRPAG